MHNSWYGQARAQLLTSHGYGLQKAIVLELGRSQQRGGVLDHQPCQYVYTTYLIVPPWGLNLRWREETQGMPSEAFRVCRQCMRRCFLRKVHETNVTTLCCGDGFFLKFN